MRRLNTNLRRGPGRRGITFIEAGVAMLIIVVLGILLLPGIRSARPAARRVQCLNHLRQVGTAMLNYQTQYGVLPPAYTVDDQGNPLHSWRTLILPFLDEDALYRSIKLAEPWDSPANAAALKSAPSVYRCAEFHGDQSHTNYMVIVSPESLIRATESRDLSTVTDGRTQTLMVVEVPHEHAVPWMSPHDADEALMMSITPGSELPHEDAINVMYADGHAGSLNAEIDREILHKLITADSGDTFEDTNF
ncbi:DUF1559 family PulG-like putative transporter [Rubinisphaera margarita]|uniref:DUF1559 family PulG-like putative transporter n=1 Tax=Rubinisphaera margarita TaxID=2909586 RepID=UPI001EE87D2F|nr:DUF1559 domain-containing protein [Rubinisphaera margarita]MCG6156563.1 DUF1559 domain-containing protein [Rubinisphaera margarita]